SGLAQRHLLRGRAQGARVPSGGGPAGLGRQPAHAHGARTPPGRLPHRPGGAAGPGGGGRAARGPLSGRGPLPPARGRPPPARRPSPATPPLPLPLERTARPLPQSGAPRRDPPPAGWWTRFPLASPPAAPDNRKKLPRPGRKESHHARAAPLPGPPPRPGG